MKKQNRFFFFFTLLIGTLLFGCSHSNEESSIQVREVAGQPQCPRFQYYCGNGQCCTVPDVSSQKNSTEIKD